MNEEDIYAFIKDTEEDLYFKQIEIGGEIFKVFNHPLIKENTYYVSLSGKCYCTTKGDFLATHFHKGYYYYSFSLKKGKSLTKQLAYALLYTWKGAPPIDMPNPTVDHIDGNPLNNSISNLQWLSFEDNLKKRQFFLKPYEVRLISFLISKGVKSRDIAAINPRFSYYSVCDIRRKRYYREISKDYF